MRRLGERGASVTAVLLIIAIVTALGAVFASLFSTGVEETTSEVLSTRALYAAEAGVETAIGRLRKTPVAVNWAWRDGYMGKAVGGSTFDAEVLEYEERDASLAAAYACERFEYTLAASGANPARTVYMVLSWDSSADMALELYNAPVADCANPLASASLLASSATAEMPERVRYRIPGGAPTPAVYTARVTGPPGQAYRMRIAHPDEQAFGTGNSCGAPAGAPFDECLRAVIVIGRHANARREVFSAFSRVP